MWNEADAAYKPFTIAVTPDYNLGNRPNQSYDFSQTHLYSDVNVSRVEFEIGGNFNINPQLFVSAAYRYIDFEDKAPYLTDNTGRADFYTVGVGYRFF